MAKGKKSEAFSANKTAQPVYRSIHEAIKSLGRHDAIAVLEEVADQVNAQLEGLNEELNEEEAE